MESKTIYSFIPGVIRGHGTLICIDYESFDTTEKAMKFSDGSPWHTFMKNSYVIN